MITNSMLNEIATSFSSVPTHLVVGSEGVTVLASDVILTGEFERIGLDSNAVDGATVKFYGSRSSVVANNDLINNLGLVKSGSLGSSDLLVGSLITSLLHTTSFDLGVEFWFTFSRI
jgi:hypothetical protein